MLTRFELGKRFLDARKPDVRVHGSVAVAGEMLAAAEHAAVSVSLHGLRAEERNALRVVPEAAHADHGVHGVGVYIEIGREIEVDADAAQLPRRDLRGESRVFRLSGRGQRHAAGNIHRVPREARHHAALLIDGDEGIVPGRAADKLLNIGAQPRELRQAFDIIPEEDDISDLIFPHQRGKFRRDRRPGEAEHQPLADLFPNVHNDFSLSYDYIIRLFKPYDKRKNIRCNGLDSLRLIRYNSS